MYVYYIFWVNNTQYDRTVGKYNMVDIIFVGRKEININIISRQTSTWSEQKNFSRKYAYK